MDQERSNLEQKIVTRLAFLNIVGVVIEVEKFEEEREAVSLDDLLVNNSDVCALHLLHLCILLCCNKHVHVGYVNNTLKKEGVA